MHALKQFKLALLSTVFLLFLLVPYAQAHNIYVSTYAYFPTQGQYINFASQQTLDTWSYDAISDYQYFNGVGFQIANANLTITRFFVEDRLNFTLYGESGTNSTTNIYVGNLGEPESVEVDGVETPIDYNVTSRILTVTVAHSSPEQVVIFWVVIPAQIANLLNAFLIVGITCLGYNIFKMSRNNGKLDRREMIFSIIAFFIGSLLLSIIFTTGGLYL